MSEQYARPPLPLSQALLQACQEYSWPGNLRELSNFIKRYLVLGDEKLAVQELHPKTDGSGPRADLAPRNGNEPAGGLKSLARSAKDEAEAEAIAKALDETNWNRKQAAASLAPNHEARASLCSALNRRRFEFLLLAAITIDAADPIQQSSQAGHHE